MIMGIIDIIIGHLDRKTLPQKEKKNNNTKSSATDLV